MATQSSSRRFTAFALAAICLGMMAVDGASTARAGFPIPQPPPSPPAQPAASDAIAFQADISSFSSGIGLLGGTGTYKLAGSCPALISDGSPVPEVFVTPTPSPPVLEPVCSIPSSTGNYRFLSCLSGTLDSSGAVSLSSADGNLNSIVYHVDVYSGAGVISGTGTEVETEGGVNQSYPVVFYGAVTLAPVPSVGSPNDCVEGIVDLQMTGSVTVVEDASQP